MCRLTNSRNWWWRIRRLRSFWSSRLSCNRLGSRRPICLRISKYHPKVVLSSRLHKITEVGISIVSLFKFRIWLTNLNLIVIPRKRFSSTSASGRKSSMSRLGSPICSHSRIRWGIWGRLLRSEGSKWIKMSWCIIMVQWVIRRLTSWTRARVEWGWKKVLIIFMNPPWPPSTRRTPKNTQ